jgi:hypothetical protein
MKCGSSSPEPIEATDTCLPPTDSAIDARFEVVVKTFSLSAPRHRPAGWINKTLKMKQGKNVH